MGRSPLCSPMYLSVALLGALLGLAEVSHVRAAIAQFVFGDSLVDQGNNNNLESIAKANFKPNGIDLSMSNDQPTGRFCNGRIVSDFLSEYLGAPSVLAYNDPAANGANILRGVNFASAGSGILDDTGAIFIQRIATSQQIADFGNVQQAIISQLGLTAGAQLISSALYAFTIGGNDWINNYNLPASSRSSQYTPAQYTQLLIDTFQQQLTTVYKMGARKISVSNIGPIGCIPDQLQSQSITGACIDRLNQLALGYNALLKPMLQNLQSQLPGSTFVYIDAYEITMDFIVNPAQHGFQTSNTACCGSGRFNGLIPCTAVTSLCSDRSLYLFWDPFHPTEAANAMFSQRLLYGPTTDVSPINISQLIAL